MSLAQTTTVGLYPLAALNYPGYRALFDTLFIPRLAVATTCPIGLRAELVALWQVFHALMFKTTRYDITSITTRIVLAFGAATGLRFLWDSVSPSVAEYLTFSETIPAEHPLASSITRWLASENPGTSRRHTRLQLGNSLWGRLSRREETRRQTSTSSGWIWFQGYPLSYRISRERTGVRSSPIRMSLGSERQDSVDEIQISSLWAFPQDIISRFLDHVASSSAVEENNTLVFTVNSLYSDRSMRECWQCRSMPSRSLSTIDMEESQKNKIVEDINLFASPARAQWYADRGIPYHRGHLFYGPPGTGKSSTAFALAGHLGASLYKTSVAEIRNETHLHQLFSQPEKGDILLLEDIDSAGISREACTDRSDERQNGQSSRISLASLLNAIDTIRKQGVIIIMSANNPEVLDEALIRDGRIDRRFKFDHVASSVIKSIFKRMYRDDYSQGMGEETTLEHMADEFVSKFPPGMRFTPAEVQGFLTRRVIPEVALREVESWIEEQAHIATF